MPRRVRASVVVDEVPGEDDLLTIGCLADRDQDDRVDQRLIREPAVEVSLVGPLLDVQPPVQDRVDLQFGEAHDAT